MTQCFIRKEQLKYIDTHLKKLILRAGELALSGHIPVFSVDYRNRFTHLGPFIVSIVEQLNLPINKILEKQQLPYTAINIIRDFVPEPDAKYLGESSTLVQSSMFSPSSSSHSSNRPSSSLESAHLPKKGCVIS